MSIVYVGYGVSLVLMPVLAKVPSRPIRAWDRPNAHCRRPSTFVAPYPTRLCMTTVFDQAEDLLRVVFSLSSVRVPWCVDTVALVLPSSVRFDGVHSSYDLTVYLGVSVFLL